LLPAIEVIPSEAVTADQFTTTDQLATTATTEDTPTPEQTVSTAEGVVTIATAEDLVTIITTEGPHTTATDLYTEFLTTLSTNNPGKFAFYLYKVIFQLSVYTKHKMQCKYFPVICNSIKLLVSYIIVKELWRKLF